MEDLIDKRLRAEQFRIRLQRAMEQANLSQSALARAIRVDRSTVSQLLKSQEGRLPNAHVIGACATALGVSADWLLSLTERPESAAELMSNTLSVTRAPRALVDERIFDWHKEATGYKIRHVPAGLPDMLKTRAMLEWEYEPHLGRTTAQAITASEERLALMRNAQSDYEIAMPVYELHNFAMGTGYYTGLPDDIRQEQFDQLQKLTHQLYPRLRLYLFDARRLYSAPITIFGPLMAVFYVGTYYMAFRDHERVETFTGHFDHLVREASINARDIPDYLGELRKPQT